MYKLRYPRDRCELHWRQHCSNAPTPACTLFASHMHLLGWRLFPNNAMVFVLQLIASVACGAHVQQVG